jgi:hypothetical protein
VFDRLGPDGPIRLNAVPPDDRQRPESGSKRRRRQAKLDKRYGARVHEKDPLGMKNTSLGNTKKKK